jgi:short-subunit dehydrogenase|tara:strand:+ start:136 stop:942 length:807 start_codon:yes stop_codon:yes gene_type:complete
MIKFTLITGASSGIGLEMANVCAEKGMNILLVSLPNDDLEAKSRSISTKYKVKAEYHECDLTEIRDINNLIKWVEENGFNVNFLINNAGFGGTMPFDEMSEEYINKMIDLNIKATTHVMNKFIPMLKSNSPSRILNVSSIISDLVAPYKSIYAATKTYVRNISLSLAYELREEGVSVSVLLPGATPTNNVVKHQIEQGAFAARATVMSANEVARVAIDKTLKGKIIITTGRKNGLIRKFMTSMPNRLSALLAINQYKKQKTQDELNRN